MNLDDRSPRGCSSVGAGVIRFRFIGAAGSGGTVAAISPAACARRRNTCLYKESRGVLVSSRQPRRLLPGGGPGLLLLRPGFLAMAGTLQNRV